MIHVPNYVDEILFNFKFERLDLDKQASYAYEQDKGSYGYMFLVTPRRKRHFLSNSTKKSFDQFMKWAEKNGADAKVLKYYEDFENRKGYAYFEVSITDPVAQYIQEQMDFYRSHKNRDTGR